jgi:glycosyltransferase involved in cell wall biosynthesis
MKVSCVIAAYNESRTVASVITAVKQVDDVTEIIVVSDGSTERTGTPAPRR